MADASKIDHLCYGLKSSLMREALRHTPRTPAEFFENAKRQEVLDHLVHRSLNTSPHEDKNDMQSPASYFSSPPQIPAVTSSSRERDITYELFITVCSRRCSFRFADI